VTAINQTGERTGTIRVEERPTESAGSAKAVVRITASTEILRADSVRAEFQSFVVGQWVRVWFVGPVRESYPVQADAATIIIHPMIAEPRQTSSAPSNR
jgi:beta-N-acetylhexosaminidase